MKLLVEGMTCAHCVRAVTATVQRLDAQARVDVDLAGGSVQVESKASTEAVIAALAEEGYTARNAELSAATSTCCGHCAT